MTKTAQALLLLAVLWAWTEQSKKATPAASSPAPTPTK
jgi:hypothetical protein